MLLNLVLGGVVGGLVAFTITGGWRIVALVWREIRDHGWRNDR